uniref:Transposase n=1 Tax=Steinernema glaseri TaxID=37863 RepID=A0A1I7ZAW1_9BILA
MNPVKHQCEDWYQVGFGEVHATSSSLNELAYALSAMSLEKLGEARTVLSKHNTRRSRASAPITYKSNFRSVASNGARRGLSELITRLRY